MKLARIWLLLLLAVLLPLRGAVAAAMPCAAGSSGMHGAQAGHHGMASHVAGQGQAHDHGAADMCNMCSAFCSLTPLPSHAPALPEPEALPAVKFPDLSTPAPSFLSDGQERPPRTL